MLRSGKPTVLLLGGRALTTEAVGLAWRVASRTNARVSAELLNGRIDRAPGTTPIDRLPFDIDAAITSLADIEQLILVDALEPNAFFAYAGRPSSLVPQGAVHHVLANRGEDSLTALRLLADLVETCNFGSLAMPEAPTLPDGLIREIANTVGELLPENAIVVDEAITLSELFYRATVNSSKHTWLQISGGSIGIGLPLAVGAAVAAPDRRVVTLQADGSALYTSQALWTQARENLNITTVVLSNRCYAILIGELRKMNVDPSTGAYRMLGLTDPEIDWVGLASGYGVKASRATNASEFREQFSNYLGVTGPRLIELVL
jgi:acetolactate synthase-1/2/3 large subunit